MDIQLEKKKGFQKKHIPYVAGGAFFLILVGWIVFGDHASTLKVDARGVNIGNVTKEQFNDFVRVNGQVQPITVVHVLHQVFLVFTAHLLWQIGLLFPHRPPARSRSVPGLSDDLRILHSHEYPSAV